ncbi:hypothetical protein PIB30_039049 [Stylosanthes scabra]|uniref:Uncharacterized protein n=1 Tax=Stylosanthes scabra TaxID=79078 RepID=A0ABU6SEC8_9FABA|nr:hypothetical protein [Stylosanthes scabra]
MENHISIELEAMLKKAQPLFTTKSCCIYKVPQKIRQLNEEAYTPTVVSIGPLHHGNSKLVTMEGHKQVYCQHFIERSEPSLTDLVSCIQQLEPQIRACYSEKIELTVEEFVKVIFIDCCFVIELFLKDDGMINDAISSKPWIGTRVIHDLLLLENQLPLFVFDKIYNLAFASGSLPSFISVAASYFSVFNKQGVLLPVASGIAHFTDLIRFFNLPPFHRRPSRKPELLILGHSASELVESGVKFIVNKSLSSHVCMLDLEFKNGSLRIPHIKVGDGSEIWLRNIVALEQCHYPQEHYILDYIIFLSQLMKTNNDAGVLIKARVIDCVFGGNYESKVSKLFGDVGKNTLVTSTNVDYLQLLHDLNAYYDHPWHSKMAILRRDYFSTPWMTAASITGIVLLILTVIQTCLEILGLIKVVDGAEIWLRNVVDLEQ